MMVLMILVVVDSVVDGCFSCRGVSVWTHVMGFFRGEGRRRCTMLMV